MKETIFINKWIHKKAKLSKEDFLQRVSGVRAIRTEQSPMYKFNLRSYIMDEYDLLAIDRLSNAVRNGDFSGIQECLENGEKVFGLIISDQVAAWFKNCPAETIKKQIILWIAFLMASNPEGLDVLCEQLLPDVFSEAKLLYDKFFQKRSFECSSRVQEGELMNQYQNACSYYYGSTFPEILSPLLFSSLNKDKEELAAKWGYDRNMFEFSVKLFYFSCDDWEEVIKKKRRDDLRRSESREDVWSKWRKAFLPGNHKLSLFSNNDPRGKIYIIREENSGNYKIGYTSLENPDKRRAALQTGNSKTLTLEGAFPCASKFAESALHDLFKPQGIQGEWFALTPEDVENILDPEWRRRNLIL